MWYGDFERADEVCLQPIKSRLSASPSYREVGPGVVSELRSLLLHPLAQTTQEVLSVEIPI